jgi:hypothetical protein
MSTAAMPPRLTDFVESIIEIDPHHRQERIDVDRQLSIISDRHKEQIASAVAASGILGMHVSVDELPAGRRHKPRPMLRLTPAHKSEAPNRHFQCFSGSASTGSGNPTRLHYRLGLVQGIVGANPSQVEGRVIGAESADGPTLWLDSQSLVHVAARLVRVRLVGSNGEPLVGVNEI